MPTRLIAVCLLATILIAPGLTHAGTQSQQQATQNQQQATQNQQQASTTVPVKAGVLVEDTPIRLRLTQTLSSGTNKVNDKVDFE